MLPNLALVFCCFVLLGGIRPGPAGLVASLGASLLGLGCGLCWLWVPGSGFVLTYSGAKGDQVFSHAAIAPIVFWQFLLVSCTRRELETAGIKYIYIYICSKYE